MCFKLSSRSKERREGINPALIAISDLAIQISLVDFGHGPHSGLRDADEQRELFDSGRSRADGYGDKSDHQSGNALDFFAFVDGRASWEPEHLAMVACAFLQAASLLGHRVEWGGLWRGERGGLYGWDMPHIRYLGPGE